MLVDVPVAFGVAVNEMIAVFDADVIDVKGEHPAHVPPAESAPNTAFRLVLEVEFPVTIVRLRVTPEGRLLNVNRICELLPSLGAPVLPLLSCVAVLQQAAQPSVIVNEPKDRAIDPLVKMVAVPGPGLPMTPPIVELPGATPMANPVGAMPGPKELMIVPVVGEPSK